MDIRKNAELDEAETVLTFFSRPPFVSNNEPTGASGVLLSLKVNAAVLFCRWGTGWISRGGFG
jgi:hypothetical protein